MILASDLFSGLGKETMLSFLREDGAVIEDYRRGENIFDTKVFRKSIALILSGTATVYIPSTSGQEMPMRKLSRNSFFGVATLFSDEDDYVSRIVALTDMKVLFISQEITELMIRKEPVFAINLIRFLSSRIRFLNSKISLLSNSSSMDSLVEYLVNRAVKSGGNFAIGGSYTLLAKSLNISRSSLYRNLEDLEQKGLISREGKTITVSDISALTNYIL